MKDDSDDKVLNLIRGSSERASAALRVARVSHWLKEDILQDFWTRGESYLKKKLAERSLKYWTLDRIEGTPLQTRYEIAIVAKGVGKKTPHPKFSFFQFTTAKLFRWELAVSFDDGLGNHEKIELLPEAKKLAEVMDGSCSMPKKRTWDGYCLFNTDDSKGIERTLAEEMAKSTDVSEFFETGWKIFERLEPHLRRLNDAVLLMR